MKTVEYDEAMGSLELSDAFLGMLEGKDLESQMACYRAEVSIYRSRWSYGSEDSSSTVVRTYALQDCEDVAGLIVKEGLLAGVVVRNSWGIETTCLPNQSACTYYASDDEGSGSDEREDEFRLVCVPERGQGRS